jgi:hypothetical protein
MNILVPVYDRILLADRLIVIQLVKKFTFMEPESLFITLFTKPCLSLDPLVANFTDSSLAHEVANAKAGPFVLQTVP